MARMQKEQKQCEYIRDGRSPVPVLKSTSKVMRANKGSGTSPEKKLRKALWNSSLKGYRLNAKQLPGRPDIVFPGRKLAIFVHGCYWHRCPKCDLPLPRSHSDFWTEKFRKNVERDEEKIIKLREQGWKVLTVWECEINEDVISVVSRVAEALNRLDSEPEH